MFMPKYILKFEDPNILNELKKTIDKNTPDWHYTDSENPLELDTDTWTISCLENNISGSIQNWKVDEANYSMGLEKGREIDFKFTISMVGQICTTEEMSTYLEQLKKIFLIEPNNQEDNEDLDIDKND